MLLTPSPNQSMLSVFHLFGRAGSVSWRTSLKVVSGSVKGVALSQEQDPLLLD